jgi:hypothetical protein
MKKGAKTNNLFVIIVIVILGLAFLASISKNNEETITGLQIFPPFSAGGEKRCPKPNYENPTSPPCYGQKSVKFNVGDNIAEKTNECIEGAKQVCEENCIPPENLEEEKTKCKNACEKADPGCVGELKHTSTCEPTLKTGNPIVEPGYIFGFPHLISQALFGTPAQIFNPGYPAIIVSTSVSPLFPTIQTTQGVAPQMDDLPTTTDGFCQDKVNIKFECGCKPKPEGIQK